MSKLPYRRITLARTLALSALAANMACWAQTAPEPLVMDRSSTHFPYLVDSSSSVVHNNFGQCWRTGSWTIEAASTAKLVGRPFPVGCYCEKDLVAKATCEPVAVVAEMAPTAAGPAVTPPVASSEKVSIPSDALFAFDRAVVTPDGKTRLRDYAEQLKTLNLETVVATGHTDRIGTNGYNQALSERRALAVKLFLVANGVEEARVFIESKGESEPVTGESCNGMGNESGHNAKLVSCLAPDRRVVLEAIGQKR
jgi:OmpA-OmpF porin, OOP family